MRRSVSWVLPSLPPVVVVGWRAKFQTVLFFSIAGGAEEGDTHARTQTGNCSADAMLVTLTVLAVASAACALPQQAPPQLYQVPRSSAVADVPYNEVISTRFTCDGSPSIVPWPVAPVATAVYQTAATSANSFIVLGDNGLWTMQLPVVRNSSTPGMLGNDPRQWNYPVVWAAVEVKVNAATDRVAVDANYPGGIVAIVRGAQQRDASGVVDVVSCTGSDGRDNAGDADAVVDCKLVSSFEFSAGFGAVQAVATSGSGGVPDIWIGCDAGLVFFSGAEGAFTWLLDADASDVGGPVVALAVRHGDAPQVAAGNTNHLWFYANAMPNDDPWWEWATDVPSQSGGLAVVFFCVHLSYQPC